MIYFKNQRFFQFKVVALLLAGLLLSQAVVACGNPTATTISRSLATAEAPTTAASNTEVAMPTASSEQVNQPAVQVPTSTPATGQSAQSTATPTPAVAQAQAPLSDQAESNSVVGVVKRLNPAVVTVYNRTRYNSARGSLTNPTPAPRTTPSSSDGAGNNFVLQGIGSGIFISQDGYIVTNDHVIDGQDDLMVALNDGKATVPAKLVGRDKLGDIAVIKVDTTAPAFAKWADSVEVGETVVAIGAALGNFRNSVSKGVVSGINRTLPGDSGTNIYIQTDTAINHGNSGGPLFNLRGEIVGINTAVLRSTGPGRTQRGQADVAEGLGFAIPANIARLLVDQIISKGQVTRPYFGITYQMITPADSGTLSSGGQRVPAVEGAWINRSTSGGSGIVRGGPADKAGLKDNDVIVALDGVALNDNNPLVSMLLKYKPGDTLKVTVMRDNQTLTLELTLGERPADL